jgi:HTH-type transcriptional regulator / antitoxin HigA
MYRSRVYTSETLKLGKVFPPAVFIRDELKARGWTQRRFAAILGRPQQFVSDLLRAKRSITPQTALELAAAFDTSAQLFMNLQQSWDLSRAKPADPAIRRRARQAAA